MTKIRTLVIENCKKLYGSEPEVLVCSPGRAEIIGNHTDYNNGFALAAAIEQAMYAGFVRRDDDFIEIRSDNFPDKVAKFSLSTLEDCENSVPFCGYAKGVVSELQTAGAKLGGVSIFVHSEVPMGGGVSSSAAFELALQTGFCKLFSFELSKLEAALLCKRAENGPYVNSPCGLLDQSTIALSEKNKLLFLDFQPQKDAPCSFKLVPLPQSQEEVVFMIVVDPEVKRNLGASAYPARRAMCEKSIPIWRELLGRPVASLREVTVDEFEVHRQALETAGGEVMRKRVEHIVYENDRVLAAVNALQSGDIKRFGELLTESGKSALGLYELDEKTPELTQLLEYMRLFPKILGARNMGGGFSANCLALIRKSDKEAFQKYIDEAYCKAFGRHTVSIVFEASNGVELL